MACLLSARGKRFAVDNFVRLTGLRPDVLWRKGEVIAAVGRVVEKKQQYSGFSIAVSRRGRDDLAGQVKDAKAFLQRKRAVLKRLRRTHGVSDVWLDFGVLLREDAIHVDWLPDDLVKLAARIPVTLSISHYLV